MIKSKVYYCRNHSNKNICHLHEIINRNRTETEATGTASFEKVEKYIQLITKHKTIKDVQNWVYLDKHFSSAAQRREYMWALWIYVEAWT